MLYLMSWLFGDGAKTVSVSPDTRDAERGQPKQPDRDLTNAAHQTATFRIEQTAGSSTLLENDTPVMVIEHSDVDTARFKVKMLLLNEAQERTGPGDVLELA